MSERSFSEFVKDTGRDAGFDLCGIAPVDDFAELKSFPDWIAAGHAGEMKYLEARNDKGELRRASLKSVFPWARSVIVCAINYNTAHPYSTEVKSGRGNRRVFGLKGRDLQPRRTLAESCSALPEAVPFQSLNKSLRPQKGQDASDLGWISRYAWSREDYHNSVLRRLRQLEARIKQLNGGKIETRSYVDTGPIVERVYAKYAGVGWQGKNTCLINQKIGSWLFLGVIVTSLEIAPDVPAPDRCGTCTRCIDACPTQALIAPHQLDSNKCISYLTIEKRGSIPEEFREGIGHQVFGCDICQDVCPWNRKAPTSDKPEFQPREGLVNPALAWLAEISEEEFRETFRGSPIKRTKRSGLRRNALVAIGNSGDRRLLPVVEQAVNDSDPVVAETARWARERLRSIPPI